MIPEEHDEVDLNDFDPKVCLIICFILFSSRAGLLKPRCFLQFLVDEHTRGTYLITNMEGGGRTLFIRAVTTFVITRYHEGL